MKSDIITLTYAQNNKWMREYLVKNGFDKDRISGAGLVFDRSNYDYLHFDKFTYLDTLTYKIIDKQKYLLAKIEYGI